MVSVIIPVRDEPDAIVTAVESALRQRYDGALEVVVADGSIGAETSARLAELATSDARVRVVANEAGTTPAGLNAAIGAARGDVLVRCDAHAVLPPGYVARAVATLQRTGAANVGGVQRAIGTAPFQRAVAMAMSTPLAMGDARFHYGGPEGPTDTVYLGVFRREAVEAVGLFDETLLRNQDYELNVRLRAAGEVVYFDPDLAVEYHPRSTPGALWRQFFDYGRWKRVVLRRHPSSLRWRQLAAPALVAGLAGGAVLAMAGRTRLLRGVTLAYGTVLTTAATRSWSKTRDRSTVLVPGAMTVMHLAWGSGFLAETLAPAQPPISAS